MRKVFEVELSSQDGFCAELTLPATPYALLDAVEKLELADGEAPGWKILRLPICGRLSPYLDQGGGKLTGYGYVQPSTGPSQDMEQGQESDEMRMM